MFCIKMFLCSIWSKIKVILQHIWSKIKVILINCGQKSRLLFLGGCSGKMGTVNILCRRVLVLEKS